MSCRLHGVALTIGAVVICSVVVFHRLSNSLDARQAVQEPQDVEAERLVAEAGDADAQYSLGLSCQNGDGVPQDDVEAVPWFGLAADDLTTLEVTMTSEQIAEAKRLTVEWKPTTKP